MLSAEKFSSPLQIVIVLLNLTTHRTNSAAGRACNPSLLTISNSLRMEFKVVYLSRYLGAGKDVHQPIHTRLQMARIIAGMAANRIYTLHGFAWRTAGFISHGKGSGQSFHEGSYLWRNRPNRMCVLQPFFNCRLARRRQQLIGDCVIERHLLSAWFF